MPAIDAALLFDVLLGLVVLLFVPFGVRRGVAKEAMVSGGILLGAVMADIWAERWGNEVAARFDVAPDTARFAVAVVLLAAGALVLGYGGGAALGRVRQGGLARVAGGVLAAINAGLLLAYGFRFLQRYLRAGRDPGLVDDGVVGRALVRDFDWLLVGGASVVLLCVVLGLIVTGFRHRNAPFRAPDDGATGGVPTRQRPIRLPRGADAGKYEPTPGTGTEPEPRPGRFGGGGSSLGRTPPELGPPTSWRSGNEPDPGGDWPRPRAMTDPTLATNGHALRPASADHWLRRAAPTTRFGGLDHGADGQPPRGTADFGAHADDRAGDPPDQANCPTCGASVGRRDIFCADCGTTL